MFQHPFPEAYGSCLSAELTRAEELAYNFHNEASQNPSTAQNHARKVRI